VKRGNEAFLPIALRIGEEGEPETWDPTEDPVPGSLPLPEPAPGDVPVPAGAA
jgi:hypothetical protein